jgi:hypothetical protein
MLRISFALLQGSTSQPRHSGHKVRCPPADRTRLGTVAKGQKIGKISGIGKRARITAVQ